MQEDENLTEQIDEMVVQLWNVVNEKNDIVRRQTELDYLRRGHRLEVKIIHFITQKCLKYSFLTRCLITSANPSRCGVSASNANGNTG